MRRIRFPQIILLGVFLLAGLIAFSPNLNSYFLSDDFVQIGKVLHGDYSVVWGQEHGGFFRPLFICSYVIDSRIWSTRPFGYHLTNVLLHALNAFLVSRLAASIRRPLNLDKRRSQIVAASAAVLFLLHPSHSEAVIWISGRADLLATSFVLASLLAYLVYEAGNTKSWLLASIGFFAMALLAKESAICMPILILIIGWSRRVKLARLATDFAAFAVILILFVIMRAFFIGSLVGGYGTSQHLNFSAGWLRDRLLEALVRSALPPLPNAWLAFLFKPLQSPIFYLIVFLVVAGMTAALILRRRLYQSTERNVQNKFLLTIFSLFLVSLLPVINLRLSLYQTLGERFLYLPTVFACLLIAYFAAILMRDARVVLMFIVLVVGLYSWSLYRTSLVWREAAGLTFTLSSQLINSASHPSIVVLNAPDSLHGVPVFHNGLPEAVRWFHREKSINEVQIAAFQELQAATDETVVSGTEVVTLRPANRADRFSRVTATDCLQASSPVGDTLIIYLNPCAAASQTFFYSGQRFNELHWSNTEVRTSHSAND
jgi:hypothetical protein